MRPDPELLEELRAARISGRDSARVRLIGAALILVPVTAFWLSKEWGFAMPRWVDAPLFYSVFWGPPVAATGLMWLAIGRIRAASTVFAVCVGCLAIDPLVNHFYNF